MHIKVELELYCRFIQKKVPCLRNGVMSTAKCRNVVVLIQLQTSSNTSFIGYLLSDVSNLRSAQSFSRLFTISRQVTFQNLLFRLRRSLDEAIYVLHLNKFSSCRDIAHTFRKGRLRLRDKQCGSCSQCKFGTLQHRWLFVTDLRNICSELHTNNDVKRRRGGLPLRALYKYAILLLLLLLLL